MDVNNFKTIEIMIFELLLIKLSSFINIFVWVE